MGAEGIGPSTSVLSGQRSTTELRAQTNLIILAKNHKNVNTKKEATRECVAKKSQEDMTSWK